MNKTVFKSLNRVLEILLQYKMIFSWAPIIVTNLTLIPPSNVKILTPSKHQQKRRKNRKRKNSIQQFNPNSAWRILRWLSRLSLNHMDFTVEQSMQLRKASKKSNEKSHKLHLAQINIFYYKTAIIWVYRELGDFNFQ